MLDGPIYSRAVPKLINNERVTVLADVWNNGHYKTVQGYTLHKCQEEATATV